MTTKTREASVRTEADTATRERILLEASRLFRHHGYAATTLREVADAAGIKAGTTAAIARIRPARPSWIRCW